MSTDQQREQQLVRGTVTSTIAKGGDTAQIVVRPDNSQYEKRLWTKDVALVQHMNAQGIGQRFDFMCNASYWNNNEGKQVRSLWVEALGQYGSLQEPPQVQPQAMPQGMPQAQPMASAFPMGTPAQQQPSNLTAQPMPQGSPAEQRLPEAVRELRIMRQTAMKCACIFLPYLEESARNLHGLEQVAEWFVRYFQGGPQQRQVEGNPNQPPLPVGGSEDGERAPWDGPPLPDPSNPDFDPYQQAQAAAPVADTGYSGDFPPNY